MKIILKSLWVAMFDDTLIFFVRETEPTFYDVNSLSVLLRDFNNLVSAFCNPEELSFKFFREILIEKEDGNITVADQHKEYLFKYTSYTHFQVCHNGFMKSLDQFMDSVKEKAESEKQKEQVSALLKENFHLIVKMFNEVQLKKPVVRLKIDDKGYKISKAPDTGRNKGYLYLNVDNDYIGKISPEGDFSFAPSLLIDTKEKEIILENLKQLAENPKTKMIEYGRETGCCGLCGRELSDAKSIEIGIGPICLEKWGM